MRADQAPQFRPLGREECESLLARNRVGRIAFARRSRVEIIPVHYLFANGVLCGRTARGTRLARASESFPNAWPAAFEVDEVDGPFDWRSVVVHGNVHAATPGDKEWRRNTREWEKLLHCVRLLIPEALAPGDPTAFRDVLIRMDAAEISGREARPALPPPGFRACPAAPPVPGRTLRAGAGGR